MCEQLKQCIKDADTEERKVLSLLKNEIDIVKELEDLRVIASTSKTIVSFINGKIQHIVLQ